MAEEPPTKKTKTADFKFDEYTWDKFKEDTKHLEPEGGRSSTQKLISMTQYKKLGRLAPHGDSFLLTVAKQQFVGRLEIFGLRNSIPREKVAYIQIAVESMGVIWNKTEVDDIKKLLARTLALKYCEV